VSELAVEARGLVKRYGENIAVDGIDLDIPAPRSLARALLGDPLPSRPRST
jgi:hypothetical protein